MIALWDLLGSPTATPVLQLAADGRWESAEILPIGSDAGVVTAAADRLSRNAKYLAMEVMWPGHAFVGTGWMAEHWPDATSAAGRVAHAAPLTAESALTALLGETPGDNVESADLGAVNAWMSVGPERLWRPGDQVVVPTLEGRPDLVECTHPVAVELSLGGTRPQWAAIVVSAPDGVVHRLDPGRLAAAMSIL